MTMFITSKYSRSKFATVKAELDTEKAVGNI